MKKLIIALLLILPFTGKAQTTLEEWNYVTKGYKIERNNGLDTKKGYNVVFDKKQKNKYSYCDFYFVYKNRQKIAIMVHTNYRGDNYYCIPKLGNPDVEDLYNNQIYELTRLKNPVSNWIIWQMTKYINWN